MLTNCPTCGSLNFSEAKFSPYAKVYPTHGLSGGSMVLCHVCQECGALFNLRAETPQILHKAEEKAYEKQELKEARRLRRHEPEYKD